MVERGGGTHSGPRRRVLKALIYVLPWWILVPVVAVLLHHARVDAGLTPIREAEALQVRGAMRGLHRTVDQLSHDIRLLARVVIDICEGLRSAGFEVDEPNSCRPGERLEAFGGVLGDRAGPDAAPIWQEVDEIGRR